jgi:hypothetical protein
MKNPARLFYLVPKPEFIRKLDWNLTIVFRKFNR